MPRQSKQLSTTTPNMDSGIGAAPGDTKVGFGFKGGWFTAHSRHCFVLYSENVFSTEFQAASWACILRQSDQPPLGLQAWFHVSLGGTQIGMSGDALHVT